MTAASRVTRRFIDPRQIDAAIEAVKKMDIDAVLAGGAAMQIWGSDRLTRDVDFLATAAPTERRWQPLSLGGVRGVVGRDRIPVDIIVRDDDYAKLYEEAIDRAVRVKGVAVPVVRPEYLAAMKLAAARAKDDEDLRALIRLDAIDLAATREIILRHLGRFAVDEFNRIVDEVAWRSAREK